MKNFMICETVFLSNHACLENYAVLCKSGEIHLHSTGHLLNPEDMTPVERDLKLHGSQRMTANKPKKKRLRNDYNSSYILFFSFHLHTCQLSCIYLFFVLLCPFFSFLLIKSNI